MGAAEALSFLRFVLPGLGRNSYFLLNWAVSVIAV